MRFFWMSIVIAGLLSGCAAGQYRYQTEQNSSQWQGQNVQALEKSWGPADQVMHARNGTSYYVYNSNAGTNFFNSTNNDFALRQSGGGVFIGGEGTGNMNLNCTTLFVTDKTGTVTQVQHTGHNCGGEWVKRTPAAQN